jgi:radical SAM protein with 4Fe4S-binding SPASM domain
MKEVKAIEIEINSHCNRKCTYCPNVDQERVERGVMSKSLFNKILLELKILQYSGRISFSFYNEPLLVDDLEFFSEQVKRHLPKTKILIYTNGTLLTISRLESLILAGVDYFVVTKHKGEKSYIFDKTYQEWPNHLLEKYVKYQTFEDLKLTNRGGLLSDIKKTIDSTVLPCLIPLQMLTITNKGTVVPCFEDYHQIHEMGNINEKTLLEIWNSSAYVLLRKKLLMGLRKNFEVCSKCNRTEMVGIY